MKKLIPLLERILRIIMLVVAAALLAAAISLTGAHMANKNLEKTKITGTIVPGESVRSIHAVRYEWHGETLVKRPIDVYFHKLGDTGDKITVYVANAHPERLFTTERGDALITTAGFMGGWGLLLLVILIAERQLLTRIQRLEKLEQEQETKLPDSKKQQDK